VTTKRPVNLEISTIHFPIPAIASILHRISGIVAFVGIAFLLYGLDQSLAGEAGFAAVAELMTHPLSKLVVWGTLSALAYHLVAGIRHLVMDMGVGETLEGGRLSTKITFVVSAVLIVLLGVWIW
jgi:succinate dehydrogenase / fumarate reductase cytochrome b subunit